MLLAGVLLWVALQLPLLVGFYFLRAAQEARAQGERRSAMESLLVDSLAQGSRFGDVVNARGQVLRLGEPLGLLDIGICQGHTDILARFQESRCQAVAGESSKHSVTIAGAPVDLVFYWDDTGPSIVQTLGGAAVLSSSFSLLMVLLVAGVTYAAMSRKVRGLADELSRLSEEGDPRSASEEEPEFLNLRHAIFRMRERMLRAHELNRELGLRAAVADLARQVSHDIRSPLTALGLAVESLRDLPEAQKSLILGASQRINDIANNLLRRGRSAERDQDEETAGTAVARVEIVPLVESLLEEKKLLYRDRPEIEIRGDVEQARGVFVRIDPVALASALSNFVNNSVEAITGAGRVLVALRAYPETVALIVSDDGRGIEPEVLGRLGGRGVSHGKDGGESGSGLGLFHARETAENAGGTLSIQSQPGLGTMVSMTIPRLSGVEG